MTYAEIRPARQDDVPAIFHVRTSVRENALNMAQLAALGITPETVAAAIDDTPCAWVATIHGDVVGFSMVDLDSGCLFAAFVLPGHEGHGLGTALIHAAEAALFTSHAVAWLGTAGNSRAARLYRHLGWGNESLLGDGDIRMEKRRA